MALTKEQQALYTRALHEELKAAMGCTEPIAIAYCAAYAVRVLGRRPERYEVQCSGNIIKNVKAVTVPQTGGLKGIEAATLAGAIGGNADLELEVVSRITPQQIEELHAEIAKNNVKVALLESPHTLHIIVTVFAGDDVASVEIVDTHTNLGKVTRNGEVLHEAKVEQADTNAPNEREAMNVKDILAYADEVNLDDVREVLERQIQCNSDISAEGLANPWGACVGRTLLRTLGDTPRARIMARAAAGSDARMNGCALPVVINSGSGNQGITASMPVVEYAAQIGATHEQLLRALCVSNLTAIHQKTSIGRLSAFCGAVSAATGAVTGIAYLDGASYEVISQMIINSLGNVGGMVCDGAKSSCAAKITSALQSALLGYDMAKEKLGFFDGEGIVSGGMEGTVASVGRMAAKGMHSTDIEILHIMIGQ